MDSSIVRSTPEGSGPKQTYLKVYLIHCIALKYSKKIITWNHNEINNTALTFLTSYFIKKVLSLILKRASILYLNYLYKILVGVHVYLTSDYRKTTHHNTDFHKHQTQAWQHKPCKLIPCLMSLFKNRDTPFKPDTTWLKHQNKD